MPATLTTRRFTVDECYRMAEAGILGPGERVELIEGEVVQMAAIESRHAACVNRLNRFLNRAVGHRALITVQNPVRLSDLSEPAPDVAVIRPREDDYAAAHPSREDVFLIIEVADTTMAFDREVKAPLYAAATVPEYWLVDIPADRVEVYRDPAGGGYREVTIHGRGDVLRPLAVPDLRVPLERVLP
jgi:Uma2 family endonuclease